VRRGVFDVLRRGVDNTVANWPLILIRLAEVVLFGILAVLTVIAAFVPTLVSVGVEVSKIESPDDIAEAMMALASKWILLVWVFVALAALMLVFVAMHAFVEAGSARVYVDGERAAGALMDGPRSRYRAFTMERWLRGGTSGWWTIFWVYNLAWSVAGLILLIPLLPTAILMLLLREKPELAVGLGCVGLVATALLLVVVGIVTGMWVNRAIATWAVRRQGARDALAFGWVAVKGDLGRHLLIVLAIIVVAMAGSTFFAGFSMFSAFGDAFSGVFRNRHNIHSLFTFPVQMIGSLLSSVFSAMVSAWYLASYSSIAAEHPDG
jgi:hypothetical protein